MANIRTRSAQPVGMNVSIHVWLIYICIYSKCVCVCVCWHVVFRRHWYVGTSRPGQIYKLYICSATKSVALTASSSSSCCCCYSCCGMWAMCNRIVFKQHILRFIHALVWDSVQRNMLNINCTASPRMGSNGSFLYLRIDTHIHQLIDFYYAH